MKRIICLIIISVAALACNKPKTIPDDQLKTIVREIYLTNAYCDAGVGFITGVGADSLDIYSPIFEKYGYEPRDLMYTIDNLSRRKSIRFTDIIDEVVQSLEAEGQVVFDAVAMLDSVDNILGRRYKKEVYKDSVSRHLTKASNMEKPDLTLPVTLGRYEIIFSYALDTTDKNSYLQYTHQIVDSAGKMQDQLFRSYVKGERRKEKVAFEVTKDNATELKIFLARTGLKAPAVRTDLTVDSLTVTYFLPQQEARDSLSREIFPLPAELSFLTSSKKTKKRDPKDFVTLRPDTTGTAQRRDSLLRQ